MKAKRTSPTTRGFAAGLSLLLAASLIAPVIAQTVPPSPASRSTRAEEVVVLSPFEVSVDQDRGYQAGNTISGSRLNTKLKDTPAAISPFTMEFLSDLAANDINEALAYATNFEPEFEDSNSGFNAPSARGSDHTRTPFRVRGIAASIAIDMIESAAPQDNYNTERVEISSGPNSVLFGLGTAGGLVSTATKRAVLERNKYTAKAQLSSWKGQRYEIDLNQGIVPGKLALRLAGLYGDREGWRYWDFEDTRRWTGAVTFRPWKTTTVTASYENGDFSRHITFPWNAGDQIKLWRERGSPRRDTGAATEGVVSLGGTNRLTVIENDGTLYNLRNKMQSLGWGQGATPGPTLLEPIDHPYHYSFGGPGTRFRQDFTNYKFTAEQRIGSNLVAEAAYLHTDSFARATTFTLIGNSVALRGDPNLTLPPLAGGATIPNPRAGELYMESAWRPETTGFSNDVVRLTTAYDLDLEKWGQHRFALLGETSKVERQKRTIVEVLADAAGVPFGNANPENAANQLFRRQYVTPGDFRTYYQGNMSTPVAPVTVGGRTYSVRTVAFNAPGNNDSRKLIDSGMFAMQNYWWNRRLITTFGYRVDLITFKDGVTERLAANDPLVTSGQRLANEWYPVPGKFDRYRYRTTTETEGAVFHLNERFSLFYNQSTNVGAPRFDRQIVPKSIPPLTTGKGRDFGLMIDLTKDGRYFARLNYFDTQFLRDAAVAQTNYFTNGVADMLDALLSARLITQTEYDARLLGNSAALVDVISKGVEVEFVANPSRNWTLRLGYSYSDRFRDNYFLEREPYWSEFKTFATSRATPTLVDSNGLTIAQEIASVEQLILDYIDEHSQSYATRPHKGNITGRYSFTEGKLKDVFVGGGFRYQGRNFMQEDVRPDSPTRGKKYYGEPIYGADWFIGYRWKAPWLKSRVQLQLNVRNAFNWSLVSRGRYNEDFTGIRRIYLQEPRNFRFTASTEF